MTIDPPDRAAHGQRPGQAIHEADTIRRVALRILVIACCGSLVIGLTLVACLQMILGRESLIWRSQTMAIAAQDAAVLTSQHIRTAHDLAESIRDRQMFHELLTTSLQDAVIDQREKDGLAGQLSQILDGQPDLLSIALFDRAGVPMASAGVAPPPLTSDDIVPATLGGEAVLVVALQIPTDARAVRIEAAYRLAALHSQFRRQQARDHLIRSLESRDSDGLLASSAGDGDQAAIAISGTPLFIVVAVDPAAAASERHTRTRMIVALLAGLVVVVAGSLALLLRPLIMQINRQSAQLERSYLEQDALARDLHRSNSDLEQFAFFASHDLQEPLRMVSSYLGLLRTYAKDALAEKPREFLDRAIDGARRMHDLINALLAYARVDSGADRRDEVPLADVVAGVERDLGERLEEVAGRIDTGKLGSVFADRHQLAHVIQNLLSNALKYRSPERQPVVRVEDADGADGMAVISVIDNGRGIAEADRDRVFDLFERGAADRSIGGSGMGLAICRKIIDRHHGRIWIEANPSGGTIVRFTLPRRRGDAGR